MAAAKGLLRGAGAAMKPSEIRDANYEQIRATWLAAKRWDVYCAFLKHGPGTTRQVATESGIDLLTLRPRVTELCEFGFVVLAEGEPRMDTNEHEGRNTRLRLPAPCCSSAQALSAPFELLRALDMGSG
jgi:hypothetical protein